MNAPISADALKQDKLHQLLNDLKDRVIVNGPGDVVFGARNIYTDQALFE